MDINSYISSGIVELYVMGLCNVEEKAEVEALRKQFPILENAIRNYEISLEKELMRTGVAVPAAVDEKLLATFSQPSQQADEVKVLPVLQSGRNRFVYAFAAVSTILLGFCMYTIYDLKVKLRKNELLVSENKSIETLPPSDYKILNDPGITPVAMYGVGSHSICRCTMFWDKKTGKAYIILHHLPTSSDKSDYQLWAFVNGQAINIGIIDDSIRGRFIEMKNIPAGVESFSVTLEKAGGVATPTEDVYLRGRI